MSDGARKADRRFTYLANPEVEAKRQRPMKTNADLKTNAGFTDFFSLAGRWIFFFETGVSPWPRLASNSRQSSCLSSPRAGIAVCPGPALSEPSSTQSPPLCPGAWLRGRPSASGSRRALGRGCSADTPPRPVTLRAPRAPRSHTPPGPQRPPPARTRRAAPLTHHGRAAAMRCPG